MPFFLSHHNLLRLTWLILFQVGVVHGAQAQDVPTPPSPDTLVHDALEQARATSDASTPSEPMDEPSPVNPDEELSDAELAELEAALGEDADSQPDTTSTAASGNSGLGATRAGRVLQSMNPDISLILDVALAAFSNEPLQSGAHDPSKNGFNLQQLEMHIESSVDPFFELQANIVFAQFGVEVEEAYARSLSLPHNLQLRAGQFLTRMGRLNPTHPHAWSFLDQPLVNGKFLGPEGSRGLGAELSYLSPLPWYVELVASATMADGACCARSFLDASTQDISSPAELLYTTRIEQFFSLSDSLSLLWGISAQFGPNTTGFMNRSEIYATDLYLRWRPLHDPNRSSLSLQIEAMHRRRQVPNDVLVDSGGYGQLVWQFNLRHALGARHDVVQGIAQGDLLDPAWTSTRHRTTLQWTFYPSHFSRLRLQAGRDAPGWYEQDIWIAMAGLEVLIGAHGAHGY